MGSICPRDKTYEETYLGVQKRTATDRQNAAKTSFSQPTNIPPQVPISKMTEKLDMSKLDKSSSDGTIYYSCFNEKESRTMKDLLPELQASPKSSGAHLKTANSSSNTLILSQENIPSATAVTTEKTQEKETFFSKDKNQEFKSGRQAEGVSIDGISDDPEEKFYEANEFFIGSPKLEPNDTIFNVVQTGSPPEELLPQKRRTAEFGGF